MLEKYSRLTDHSLNKIDSLDKQVSALNTFSDSFRIPGYSDARVKDDN